MSEWLNIIRFRSKYLPAIHNSIAIFSTLNYVHCSRRRRHGCYGNEINVGLVEARPLVWKSTRHVHLRESPFFKIHVFLRRRKSWSEVVLCDHDSRLPTCNQWSNPWHGRPDCTLWLGVVRKGWVMGWQIGRVLFMGMCQIRNFHWRFQLKNTDHCHWLCGTNKKKKRLQCSKTQSVYGTWICSSIRP